MKKNPGSIYKADSFDRAVFMNQDVVIGWSFDLTEDVDMIGEESWIW